MTTDVYNFWMVWVGLPLQVLTIVLLAFYTWFTYQLRKDSERQNNLIADQLKLTREQVSLAADQINYQTTKYKRDGKQVERRFTRHGFSL